MVPAQRTFGDATAMGRLGLDDEQLVVGTALHGLAWRARAAVEAQARMTNGPKPAALSMASRTRRGAMSGVEGPSRAWTAFIAAALGQGAAGLARSLNAVGSGR